MDYSITISGRQTGIGAYTETVSVSQLNMVLTIDKTLDYGSFVVRNERPEPYEVGDMVDIDITDGVDTQSYHFIVSGDDVTQLPNGHYIHAINIIELTKILEWQTDSSRSFTQPLTGQRLTLLDVVVRLQASLPLAPLSDLFTTRVFAIDNDLRTRLLAVESPEFQFTNRNLKEMLFEIFDFIGAIPRLTKVSNNIVLTGDFYNEHGNLVPSDAFYRMKRLDIGEFSTALDSDIKNLYDEYNTVVEPAPGKYKFLSSDTRIVKEDNAILKTEYGIVEIESLKVLFDDNELDITSQIVEKEEWDQLKNLKFGQALIDGSFRDNTLFFTRYQKNITGLFEQSGILNNDTRLATVMRTALLKQSLDPRAIVDFRDIQFQITYKSMLDTRVQVKRLDTLNIKYDSKSYTGQSGNLIRADRALDRLFKLQQLLGNASIMTSERITALSNLRELGDFKDDDYIITTIEMICEKKHILTKYMWTQNYQKVSEFVDVDSEIRVYDIPARIFRRSLYIEDYVEVDLEPKPNTSFVTSAGIQTFANTVAPIPSAIHNTPVGLFTFNTEEIRTINPDTQTLIKPLTAYSGGNSINFHIEFDNPKVAGFQTDNTIRDFDEVRQFDDVLDEVQTPSGILESIGEFVTNLFKGTIEATRDAFQNIRIFRTPMSQDAINYTNDFGYLFDMDYQFVEKANFDNADSGQLPVILKSEIVRPLIEAPTHRIFKDARENLAITHSIHVLPIKGLENRIIIGKYLVERNNLLKTISTALNQFEVFTSTEPYSVTENAFSRLTDTVASQTYSVVPYSINGTVQGFTIAISQAIAKEVTWGIRKKDTRELVFVVNPGDFPIGVNNPPSNRALHFTFRSRQSFVQYPQQTAAVVADVFRPTNIQLTPPGNITDTTIAISWADGNISPTADLFEIGISTNLRDWETTTQTSNIKTFTGLTPATRHIIRIRAFIGTAFSEYAYFEATTIQPAPSPPANVQLSLINARNIRVNWEAVDEDVFGYFVEISENSNFTPLLEGGFVSVLAPRNITVFYSDTTALDFEKEYFVRVRARRGGLSSVPSTTVSITTLSKPRTLAPIIIITDVTPTTVFFRIVNYDARPAFLFVNLTGAPFSGALGSAGAGEALSGSLNYTTQTTLFAVAAATDKLGSEVASEIFVQDALPAAPFIGSTAVVVNVGFNVVNWTYETTDPIINGFVVERSPQRLDDSGFGEISALLPPGQRRFFDTFVSSGTQYTYRIRAVNRLGSTLSNTRTVTALSSVPNAPSNLTFGVLAGEGVGLVRLTWQRNSTDEDGFLIERSTGGAFTVVGGTAKAQTTYDDIAPSGNYTYRIIAYNEFGNSNPSNSVFVEVPDF